jgi:hypothetical protein
MDKKAIMERLSIIRNFVFGITAVFRKIETTPFFWQIFNSIHGIFLIVVLAHF